MIDDFLANVSHVLLSDMIFYIMIIITFTLGYIFAKRITFYMLTFVYSIVSFICVMFSNSKILTLVISLLFYFIMCVRVNNTSLIFNKKVLSFSLIFNMLNTKKEKDEKFLGRILPYSRYQLKYNHKLVRFSDIAAKGVTLITGSTGAGKTYGMKSLIKQDMNNGHSVVFFDFKGSKSIITELREFAENKGIEVYEMSSENIDFNYDPLVSLNTTGKIEALLNTRKWSADGSDAHYRSSTHLLIQKMVNTFDKIYKKDGNYLIMFYDFVKKYNYERSEYDAYTTLIKILELIITSNVKDAWNGKNERNFSFNNNNQYLVIFSFVSSNKELANSISSFVFKDMLDTGTRETYPIGLCLYIDEFGTLENSFIIKDILEKGRSCGVQTTICLQDINQIVINTNQAYLNSILGTINTFIIYSGATRSTAELISGVQINEIDKILMTLKKPYKRNKPTAMYISKYPSILKESSVDAFKIEPYILKEHNTIKRAEMPVENEYRNKNINKKGKEPREVDYASISSKIEGNNNLITTEVNDVDFRDLI